MRLETKQDYDEFVKTDVFLNFVKKECPRIADKITKVLFLGFLPAQKLGEFEIWTEDGFSRAYFRYEDIDSLI